MGRLLFGLIVFGVILGAGLIWIAKPGTPLAYAEAQSRIIAAIEEDARVLRLSGIGNLGEIPPEIADLPDLVQLDLRDTVVSDLRPLAGLEKLRILTLRDTLVQDLAPLEGLPDLDILDLSGTWVRDLEPLTRIPNLRRLDLGTTWTDSLEPITRIDNLEWVNLHAAYSSDGSQVHLDSLDAAGVTTNNGKAFAQNYRPGIVIRTRTNLSRLIRRVRLGLGALD